MSLLRLAIERSRASICILVLIIAAGIVSRANMTVEASPNPKVPVVVVSIYQYGISPEDGDRLLVRPLEKELRKLKGVKEIKSTARESVVYSVIEFEFDRDLERALFEVRAAVDDAKAEFPDDAEEPVIEEVSADDIPTIIVTVSGEVFERSLYQTARTLKERIESIPGVLKAEMTGHREEVVEAIVDPTKLDYYGITSGELLQAVSANNVLIAAGQLDTGNGRFPIKIPALLENRDDINNLPLRSDKNGTVVLSDVAEVVRTFKQATQVTKVNGQPALVIEVSKRNIANEIDVTRAVRDLVNQYSEQIPKGITVDFLLDQSQFSLGMVTEMQGNILTAMMLVMIIVVGALGIRSGVLVGFGVPFSLLLAAIILHSIGYSFNFMVLFGMLLALGMLIDGAIVITEYADQKMEAGATAKGAYIQSVSRMMWPVIASTLTTLAAFLPIMFWPGVAGEFMRYLPVTVFAVLCGSLLYALLFAPVLGAIMGKGTKKNYQTDTLGILEKNAIASLKGIKGVYARSLSWIVFRPWRILAITLFTLVAVFKLYGSFGVGVEFFVETEKIVGTVTVRAQGNLSLNEARRLADEVEKEVLQVDGIKVVYTLTNPTAPRSFGSRIAEKDQISEMLIETQDPTTLERHTKEIFKEIRERTKDIPGIFVNAVPFEDGPPVGKPVQIQLEAFDRELLTQQTRLLRAEIEKNFPDLREVTDTTSTPGIEWSIHVDRTLASKLGADVSEVGRVVQFVTNGVLVGEYRPDDAEDEVEIRVRFPDDSRGISAFDKLRINTREGNVPVNTFIKKIAQQKVDKVERSNGVEYMLVLADVEDGVLADDQVKLIKEWMEKNPLPPSIKVSFRGANEEQAKSQAYLFKAFLFALFLMFILLVAQFNSIYQAILILSSVIMSTCGVLLGLIITQSTFSVIMTGVGIVALAGIVVNNNIVLIDTFNYLRKLHPDVSVQEISISAATQRLRPVFLTTATTILGLMPLATALSVDLISRTMEQGGVVGSYWVALASSIVYGLLFSTLLTLLVTPALLMLPFTTTRNKNNTLSTTIVRESQNAGV